MNEEVNKELSIDINTAAIEELTRIPGVGPELASRIVAARPFLNLDELQRVSGISTIFIQRIAPFVRLGSTSLDEEEVQQLVSDAEKVDEDLVGSPLSEVVDESSEAPEPVVEREIQEKTVPVDEGHETLEKEAVTPQERATTKEQEVKPAIQPRAEIYNRSQMIWIAVGSMFLTLILTLMLSLGILAGINGGRLRFASPAQVSALAIRADGLKSAIDSNTQDLASLRKRVDNLDSLGGRVGTVEQSVEEIGSNMDAVNAHIEELGQKADELTDQVDKLQEQSDRFSEFFSGLSELMNNLFGSEEGGK